tara:strand:+ start:2654 stop:2863 length:210 start_codon:yes stop_codon:yes gene_type:complete
MKKTNNPDGLPEDTSSTNLARTEFCAVRFKCETIIRHSIPKPKQKGVIRMPDPLPRNDRGLSREYRFRL